MPFVIEGILTTINADGSTNIAPQGPVQLESGELLFRPFAGSHSYDNLLRSRCGVFHTTDDVLLLAQTAVGDPDPWPHLQAASKVTGQVLTAACASWEFVIQHVEMQSPRCLLTAQIVQRTELRSWSGWNRAQFAVLELAILATRVTMLPPEQIQADLARWQTVVEKTGGPREHAALNFLQEYFEVQLAR